MEVLALVGWSVAVLGWWRWRVWRRRLRTHEAQLEMVYLMLRDALDLRPLHTPGRYR